MSATHPDEATLLRSVIGELTEHLQAGLTRHVARCVPCRKERERTKRLHERLSETGDSLAFAGGDPFESRPIPRGTEAAAQPNVKTITDALGRLEEEKATLKVAAEVDPLKAARGVQLDDAAVRLAVAHLLEEGIAGDPPKEFAVFAEAVATRLAKEPPKTEGDVDAVVPRAQLVALAHLVLGHWRLFCGGPKEAGVEFRAAWVAFGDFDAPEHLVAWAEAGESLRRSYEGRPVEGRLLAERAIATFERYGLEGRPASAARSGSCALHGERVPRGTPRVPVGDRVEGRDAPRPRARRVRRGILPRGARAIPRRGEGVFARPAEAAGRGGAGRAVPLAGGDESGARQRPDAGISARMGLRRSRCRRRAARSHARDIAAEIVALAGEQGIEAARTRLAGIEGDRARGYAQLYAAQLAMPKVSSDPAMYVELAKAIASASRSLPFLKDKGPAQPVCREQVMGEAQLLESNALNTLGLSGDAREAVRRARLSFIDANEDSFALALSRTSSRVPRRALKVIRRGPGASRGAATSSSCSTGRRTGPAGQRRRSARCF